MTTLGQNYFFFSVGYLGISRVSCIILAEVVCAAGPILYASLGNDEALQKIHWKKLGRHQGSAYERKS